MTWRRTTSSHLFERSKKESCWVWVRVQIRDNQRYAQGEIPSLVRIDRNFISSSTQSARKREKELEKKIRPLTS
jgi:hypothetical protein